MYIQVSNPMKVISLSSSHDYFEIFSHLTEKKDRKGRIDETRDRNPRKITVASTPIITDKVGYCMDKNGEYGRLDGAEVAKIYHETGWIIKMIHPDERARGIVFYR